MDKDQQRITSYLVGDLPETEQTELERRYFGDTTFVDRVIRAETDLLDAYARGRLPDEMRQRVARQYLTHPTRRERLRFAQALAARVGDPETTTVDARDARTSGWQAALSWWSRFGTAVPLSLAAATVLLITTGWLLVDRVRLREALNRVQVTSEQHERDLQQQIAAERQTRDAAMAERDRLREQQSGALAAARAPNSTALVALVFAVGGIRAPGDLPSTFKIPVETEQVQLQLNLKENDYVRYTIALRTVSGQEILSRQGLQPSKIESGWRLSTTVLASRFAPGDYMLMLSGVTRDGNRDDVSTSIFRVER